MSGKYDRNHSAADWSGYVAIMPSKKHIKTPPSQLKAADDGTGIVPTDDAKASEWKKGRRDIPTSKGNSTFKLIGGPEEVRSSQWQSEAQSACQSKTTIQQLTETGRSMHIRGKRRIIPAYENVRPSNENMASRLRDENPYTLNEGVDKSWNESSKKNFNDATAKPNANLIGYRAPRGGDSFLVGLGKELAAEDKC